MKRVLGLLLAAVLLSSLSIPCAAEFPETVSMKRRSYPGFSDIPSTEVPYWGDVKACYEWGLMNGTSDTTFSPQGKLTIAQLVVLAARLYDLRMGGDGTVPDLPDYGGSYLRFYDKSGTQIASFTMEEIPAYNAAEESTFIGVINETDGSSLPEFCQLEIGFEGYNHTKIFEGVRESHQNIPGTMNQGIVGTGYRFTGPDAASFAKLTSLPLYLEEAWWFPAAFYLCSEGVMNFDGELVYRASGGNQDGSYDPLTRFSSDHASRALFAWLVDLIAGQLPVLNETVSVPDVTEETQDADAILRLYRAGILTGVDQAGNFGGSQALTRAQAAIILNRVLTSRGIIG